MKRSEYQKQYQKRKHKSGLFIIGFVLLVIVVIGSVFVMNYPRLEVVGGQTIEVVANTEFKDPGVQVKRTGKRLAATDVQPSGQVDVTKAGEYKLKYQLPYFGLKSTASRTVKVVPEKQLLSVNVALNGPEQMNIYLGREYQELGAKVEGSQGTKLQDKLKTTGKVDTNTPGHYEITYKVKDAAETVHQAKRSVNVVEKRIYLTFDDGPDAAVTPQFLKTLRDAHVKGTFFVTGAGPDELIKQAYDEGHTIGLHTYTHDYETVYASVGNYFSDLDKIGQRVKAITGEDSKIIRFPGGGSNSISANYSAGIMTTLTAEVQARGYQYFDWNVSSGDGSNQSSADVPYQNVTTNLVDGADNVVLMHDTKQTSADALKRIIDFGLANGYAFEKLEMDSFTAHHGVTN